MHFKSSICKYFGRVLVWGIVGILLASVAITQPPSRDIGYGAVPDKVSEEEGFDPAESRGLFVGIRSFEEGHWREVPFAVDDAVDLAYLFSLELGLIRTENIFLSLAGEPQKETSKEKLRKLLAANAHLNEETSTGKTKILRDVEVLAKKAGPQGLFVLAIATHGLTMGGDEYVVSSDSLMSMVAETAVPLGRVMASVDQSTTLRRLMFLDACRHRFSPQYDSTMVESQVRSCAKKSTYDSRNPFVSPPNIAIKNYPNQNLAEEIGHTQGRVLLMGATPDGFAYDDMERGNGVFTAAVIDGLRGGARNDERRLITVATLKDFVNHQVREWIGKHCPEHPENKRGIESRIVGAAETLPLAIGAASEFERRRVGALQRLHENVEPAGPIDTEMYGVIDRLLDPNSVPQEFTEALITEIQRLDRTRSRQDDFATYFSNNREILESHIGGDSEDDDATVGWPLQLKVVGRSDNISIFEERESLTALSRMEPLKPYLVQANDGDSYRISLGPVKDRRRGFVAKQEVVTWNSRRGLHFRVSTLRRERRRTVTAWQSEEKIRLFLETRDHNTYGPAFKEQFQTRVGDRDAAPFPLLTTKEVELPNGKKSRIHEVLIPVIVSETGESRPGLPQQRPGRREVAGAVTFCVVFDATESMESYASYFASTIDHVLAEVKVDPRMISAGIVLFRDLKDAEPFEIMHPMPLREAMEWLRGRVRGTVGGGDSAEPILDAVVLAQNSFLWNGGTAVRGARRIAIIVTNEDAKPKTVALNSKIPAGLDAEEVARRLLTSKLPITVFALQASDKDHGHLISVLSTLAAITGGEFYPATDDPVRTRTDFTRRLNHLLSDQTGQAEPVTTHQFSGPLVRTSGEAVIALDVLDEAVKKRLEATASEFEMTEGGLILQKAWVLEDPTLYHEKILIEQNLLESLVMLLFKMSDSTLDSSALVDGTTKALEALVDKRLSEGVNVQSILEKRLGIRFTTDLLSLELSQLDALVPEKRAQLREVADMLDDVLKDRFAEKPRIWLPVAYFP